MIEDKSPLYDGFVELAGLEGCCVWVQCSVTREQLDLLELETHKCIIREIYYSAHSEARQINQAGRADPRARDQIRTVNKYRAGPRHVSGV